MDIIYKIDQTSIFFNALFQELLKISFRYPETYKVYKFDEEMNQAVYVWQCVVKQYIYKMYNL